MMTHHFPKSPVIETLSADPETNRTSDQLTEMQSGTWQPRLRRLCRFQAGAGTLDLRTTIAA
jgi:hypothetical protein